jgi:cytoskeletal protein CcmA (bactofilin family)
MLLAILFMFAVVPAAAAATLVAEDEYVLPAGEVVEGNLYAFGSKVTIKGTVTGDLVAVGQTVEIAPGGVVKKDILAAGQAVMVGGTVEDDFRAAGFTVEVKDKAIVGGDLVAMAYNVSAGEGSLIGGDVIVAARGRRRPDHGRPRCHEPVGSRDLRVGGRRRDHVLSA